MSIFPRVPRALTSPPLPLTPSSTEFWLATEVCSLKYCKSFPLLEFGYIASCFQLWRKDWKMHCALESFSDCIVFYHLVLLYKKFFETPVPLRYFKRKRTKEKGKRKENSAQEAKGTKTEETKQIKTKSVKTYKKVNRAVQDHRMTNIFIWIANLLEKN